MSPHWNTHLSLFLVLASAPALAARPYDSCPSTMMLDHGNCKYVAGDVTRSGYRCSELATQFGDLDCPRSGPHSENLTCGAWAVFKCEEIKSVCADLRSSHKSSRKLPPTCVNAIFTITDPGLRSIPSPSELEDDLGATSRKSGPRLMVPDADVPLPESVRECLERDDPGQSEWTAVTTYSLVRPPNHFRIRKVDGWFEIALNIRPLYAGAPENRSAVVERVQGAVPCVQHFFARHRIRLDLGLSLDDHSFSSWWNSDIADIAMHDVYPRPDSMNWAVLKIGERDLTPSNTCEMMVHEISHRLGLPDRYLENSNRAPDYEPAVMSGGSGADSSQEVFMPDDLRILTEPLCKYSQKPPAVPPVPQPAPTPGH